METLTDNTTVYVLIRMARRMNLIYQMLGKKKKEAYWKDAILKLDFKNEQASSLKKKPIFDGDKKKKQDSGHSK